MRMMSTLSHHNYGTSTGHILLVFGHIIAPVIPIWLHSNFPTGTPYMLGIRCEIILAACRKPDIVGRIVLHVGKSVTIQLSQPDG